MKSLTGIKSHGANKGLASRSPGTPWNRNHRHQGYFFLSQVSGPAFYLGYDEIIWMLLFCDFHFFYCQTIKCKFFLNIGLQNLFDRIDKTKYININFHIGEDMLITTSVTYNCNSQDFLLNNTVCLEVCRHDVQQLLSYDFYEDQLWVIFYLDPLTPVAASKHVIYIYSVWTYTDVHLFSNYFYSTLFILCAWFSGVGCAVFECIFPYMGCRILSTGEIFLR